MRARGRGRLRAPPVRGLVGGSPRSDGASMVSSSVAKALAAVQRLRRLGALERDGVGLGVDVHFASLLAERVEQANRWHTLMLNGRYAAPAQPQHPGSGSPALPKRRWTRQRRPRSRRPRRSSRRQRSKLGRSTPFALASALPHVSPCRPTTPLDRRRRSGKSCALLKQRVCRGNDISRGLWRRCRISCRLAMPIAVDAIIGVSLLFSYSSGVSSSAGIAWLSPNNHTFGRAYSGCQSHSPCQMNR